MSRLNLGMIYLLLQSSLFTSSSVANNYTAKDAHGLVKQKGSIEEVLKFMANEMAKSVPVQVDADSEIFLVTAFGKHLNYNTKMIRLDKSDINLDEFKQNVLKRNLPMLCSSPLAKVWINAYGAHYNYSIYSKSGEFLFSYSANKTSCQQV